MDSSGAKLRRVDRRVAISRYLSCVAGNFDVAWRGVRGVVAVWGGDVRWGKFRLSESALSGIHRTMANFILKSSAYLMAYFLHGIIYKAKLLLR